MSDIIKPLKQVIWIVKLFLKFYVNIIFLYRKIISAAD